MVTYKQLWEKHSEVTIRREVSVKRLNPDGTYEASWTKIDDIFTRNNPISGINRKLSNTSWKFGAVSVGSCSFKILNPYMNFSSEESFGSIFRDFIRDRSQIRMREFLVDPETELVSDGITVFQGVIDSDRTFTKDIIENVTALDFLSILNNFSLNDVGYKNNVINGEFETDTDWNKTGNWVIDGSLAKYTPGIVGNLTQNIITTIGEEYTIYYKISGYIAGTLTASFGATTDSARSANGEFSFTHTATTATTLLTFAAISTTELDLDSIRVVRIKKVSEAVFDIMNRSEFTQFFSVSSSTTYINPSVDFDVDFSLYSGTIYNAFEDIAKGMNIFYVDPNDNFFYFKEVTPTVSVQHEFLVENERKVKILNVREGTDRMYNEVIFGDAVESVSNVVRRKTISINITGVISTAEKVLVAADILDKQKTKKKYFDMEIPYAPFINLLDRAIAQSFGQAPDDIARYGFSRYRQSNYGKAIGTQINQNDEWIVRDINHKQNLTTIIEMELII